MNWNLIIVVIIGVAAVWWLKRAAFVAKAVAGKLLAEGALVIDVRSPEEFRRGHISGAINIPLGALRHEIVRLVPDRQQGLLVHCLSGGRSALAQRQLKNLGYANVFNLGSLTRARSITRAGG